MIKYANKEKKIENHDYTFLKKIQTEGLSEVEFSNVVLDESNNATQSAEEIEFVQSKIKEQKQAGKDRTLNPLGVLFNIKFEESFY